MASNEYAEAHGWPSLRHERRHGGHPGGHQRFRGYYRPASHMLLPLVICLLMRLAAGISDHMMMHLAWNFPCYFCILRHASGAKCRKNMENSKLWITLKQLLQIYCEDHLENIYMHSFYSHVSFSAWSCPCYSHILRHDNGAKCGNNTENSKLYILC